MEEEEFWVIFMNASRRSMKYEQIYLSPSDNGIEFWKFIQKHIQFYNKERRFMELEKFTLRKLILILRLVVISFETKLCDDVVCKAKENQDLEENTPNLFH